MRTPKRIRCSLGRSTSRQWQQACDFYEADLESGLVHLLVELMSASFHDEALRSVFLPRLLTWHRLIEEAAVHKFVERSNLRLPVSAQAITACIGWFWTGLEVSMVLGIPEEDGHQRAIGSIWSAIPTAPRLRCKWRCAIRNAFGPSWFTSRRCSISLLATIPLHRLPQTSVKRLALPPPGSSAATAPRQQIASSTSG